MLGYGEWLPKQKHQYTFDVFIKLRDIILELCKHFLFWLTYTIFNLHHGVRWFPMSKHSDFKEFPLSHKTEPLSYNIRLIQSWDTYIFGTFLFYCTSLRE